MDPTTTSAFALPDHLAHKADRALVADDERHFAAIGRSLELAIAELSERLDAARREPAGTGQAALDRDLEVHRLTARLRALRRYGLDLCLGHVVPADTRRPLHIGRLGLTDGDGTRLLVDWRSPAAEPFFGATHADPMGLVSRRRYRWSGGRVTDYWDEVFAPEEFDGHAAALDDQSAFIASLGSSRSSRMRDVLATIAADQDAIIRASSRRPLVVDGGPGTGKTVVALHRAAYLLYSDPRLGHHRGGVLFVGPHQPYLAYVADVLPSLGEEGVQTCTLRDLVPGSAPSGRSRPRRSPASRRTCGWWPPSSQPCACTRRHRRRGWRSPRPGGTSGSARPTGRRPSTPPNPAPRTTSRATRCGRRCSPSWSTSWSTRPRATATTAATAATALTRPGRTTTPSSRGPVRRLRQHRGGPEREVPPVARVEPRAGGGLRPRLAPARADRARRRPVVGARLPADVRPVARARRGVLPAAPRPDGMDRERPAPARRGTAAPRRPRVVEAPRPA